MATRGHAGTRGSRKRKKTKSWQLLLAAVVVAGLASSWVLISRDNSAVQTAPLEGESGVEPVAVPGLENRMVLPAKPQAPRPVTLNPAAFAENAEVQASYQAAKDSPEALEN